MITMIVKTKLKNRKSGKNSGTIKMKDAMNARHKTPDIMLEIDSEYVYFNKS